MTDEKSTPWKMWTLKLIVAVIMALLPAIGVLLILLYVDLAPTIWLGTVFLLSLGIFLLGAGALLFSGKGKVWGYSLLIGFLVAPATMLLAGIYHLSLIPVPLFGNAAFLTLVVLIIGGIMFASFRSPRDTAISAAGTTGMITTASESISVSRPEIHFLRKQQEMVAGIELVEMPRSYVFQEDATKEHESMVPRFLSVVRHLTLTGIPFSIRYERRENETRVVFLTWAKDDVALHHQNTVLQDTLQGNLTGFRFRSLGYFEGVVLKPSERSVAVEMNGIPLSIEDEQQRQDPMDAVTSILQQLRNGLVQIFVEPERLSEKDIHSIQSQYRSAVESSETTVTKERTGVIHGERQESKRIVNPEAMRRAEILSRHLDRLAGGYACRTRVLAASWAKEIEEADHVARRLVGAIMGAVRKDKGSEEFKVKFRRDQKEVAKLLLGYPIGSQSVLTPSEVSAYFVLPKTDLGVRVTSRERFSSGTASPVKQLVPREAVERIECLVRSSVRWKPRIQRIIYGNLLDENGEPIKDKYLGSAIDYYDGHMLVLGTTRMGKTWTSLSIIGQAIAQGINPLIVVPSKAYEWRMLMDIFPELRIFTAGAGDIALLTLNFWDPPPNVRLRKWVDRVVQVLTLWMPNDKVISMHVEDWVYTIYELCGWDIDAGRKGRPIMFEDIVEGVIEFGMNLNYDEEVNRNFYGALVARVKSLLRKPSLVEMFNTRTGVGIPDLLSKPTIIEMEHLSGNDRTLLMGMLTAAMSEYKLANPSDKVENLLVLEEAHYILGKSALNGEANSSARQQAVMNFVEMLRVLGGTGLGLMVIDQLPSGLADEVVKLPVNVILHRLKEDKETLEMIGSYVGCTDSQIVHIRGMQRGEAIISLEKEPEPKNVRILPLSFFIRDELKVARPSDTDVIAHMAGYYAEHPELLDHEPLPKDLLDQFTKRARSIEEEEHGEFQRFFQLDDFETFCLQELGKGTDASLKELAGLFHTLVDEHLDGRVSTVVRLVEAVLEEYAHDDSQDLQQRLLLETVRLA